jgi:hypothetical protein
MTNIVAVLIVRCTHTGVYADGRPNPGSVTIYDLDENWATVNRERSIPIPPGSTVDIPMSTKTFISWHEGAICKFTMQGLLRSQVILQLRDKNNCGGPAGTGQTLRPAVLNIERVGNVLRLVLPDNVIPTTLDTVGFMEGEPVEITGLTGAFRKLNGIYVITSASPATGLAGAAVGSYLVEAPSVGPDIAAATLVGVNLCLTEGRVTAQFNSAGDVGGFGTNVIGYIGGQFFPNTGSGGGGAIVVEDEGILVDPATTLLNFIGAGVTASSAGPGAVDVTIPGGGGAPANATYVTMSLNATLTDERVLTPGTGIDLLDGGAGGAVTLSVDATFAEILANGNATGGTDILVSSGDSILGVTDLVLSPGGAVGDNVIIDGLTWPDTDGAAGDVLTTDGAGNLSFQPAASAATAVLTWGDASVAASTAVRYLDPWWENATAPLAPIQWRVPRAGTLQNMRVRHNSLVGNGNAIVYTLRVNGVASALTVSLASTAADGSDLANTVAVVAGDLVDIEVTKALAIGAGGVDVGLSMEFAA